MSPFDPATTTPESLRACRQGPASKRPTYYYTDFDLVRIDHAGSTRAWRTNVAGARAVAIHGDRALFFGGHGDDRHTAHLGRLDRGDVGDLRTLAICDPAGRRIAPDLAVGRGRHLHLLAGSTWWRIDLAILPDR